MHLLTCAACYGDGWGWKSDGLVVEGKEGTCPICKGTGKMLETELPAALRLKDAYERAGIL